MNAETMCAGMAKLALSHHTLFGVAKMLSPNSMPGMRVMLNNGVGKSAVRSAVKQMLANRHPNRGLKKPGKGPLPLSELRRLAAD